MALAASPPRETMRRVASAGHMNGGMKRVASGAALRRPPSAGNLQTHSRNSGGSELFDALLQAATADQDGALAGPSHGDPPVTSRHYAAAQLGRQRSGRMWSAPGGGQNEVDSLQVGGGAAGRGAPAGLGRAAGLGRSMPPACHPHWQSVPCRHTLTAQAAMDDFADEEDAAGGAARLGSARRRMLRRNSVSMILENPVLAQVRCWRGVHVLLEQRGSCRAEARIACVR